MSARIVLDRSKRTRARTQRVLAEVEAKLASASTKEQRKAYRKMVDALTEIVAHGSPVAIVLGKG